MANAIRQPCDEGIIRSQRAQSACIPNAAPWVLAATILGSSMAFFDETALPVALPAIQSSLQATALDAQWMVAACTLFLASLVLVALFATASAGCGLSQGPELLIAARQVPDGLDAAQSANVERAIDEAFVTGYRALMLGSAATALASALSAALLVEGKKPERER